MRKYQFWTLTVLTALTNFPIHAQTIAEKKAGLERGSDLSEEMQRFLDEVNTDLNSWRDELRSLYNQANELYQTGASQEEFEVLLLEINGIKENIETLQESWREMAVKAGFESVEDYALWHQPDSTIGQLISDYGSTDYIYLMSPDIANLPVSVQSDLPIPRSSWGDVLELVLNQNGIGIKQLNPYLRQLYAFGDDNSSVRLITNKREELQFLPSDVRICFVLTPEPSDVRRIWYFLDKFANAQNTNLQMIGRDILLIATAPEILNLLKVYDFVTANQGDRAYKLIPLKKVPAAEMAKVLETIFNQFAEEDSVKADIVESGASQQRKETTKKLSINRSNSNIAKRGEGNGLRVVTLGDIAQSLFLIGTRDEIFKAERIIAEVEGQVGEARDKVIFTYKVRHSNPEELAQVLEKIYTLLIQERVGFAQRITGQEGTQGQPQQLPPQEQNTTNTTNISVSRPGYGLGLGYPIPGSGIPAVSSLPLPLTDPYFLPSSYGTAGGFAINPRPIQPAPYKPVEYNKDRDNFIVDAKTSNVVMVLIADLLPKMKELISKLDVPKKMVHIEVLLFEKRLNRQTNYGLNLLRLGDAARGVKEGGATWNNGGQITNVNTIDGAVTTQTNSNVTPAGGPGIFEFFFSRCKSDSFPAFDLIYRFLLMQDDVSINANPSVVTLNQTEAVIAIQEEISLNVGTLQIPTTGGTQLQDTFTRAQYGIIINVTPTIHMAEADDMDDDVEDYVTLKSDIIFDTIIPGTNPERPDVIRRNVVNEARVCDGQSVIIGGLRRKNSFDSRDQIPFLGEIPGVGKLFSITDLRDESTEMFIVLTPKIIVDPCEDMDRLRRREMCRRPGDIPAFMCRWAQAHECEKNRLFNGYMTILFGPVPDRCVPYPEEYDGRG